MEDQLPSKFVGSKEAAEFLGVSYSAVWESLRRGDFPAANVQIGTKWRISRYALEALAGAPASEKTNEPSKRRVRRQERKRDTGVQKRPARRRMNVPGADGGQPLETP